MEDKSTDSIIQERLRELVARRYVPAEMKDKLAILEEKVSDDAQAKAILHELQQAWRSDLTEAYNGVIKLQDTIVQYENELLMMMNQMDSLVKCSIMIKQYSVHLKQEVEKVADKVDREGLDQRIDQLVNLIEDIKPKTSNLNVVRNAKVIVFPRKD